MISRRRAFLQVGSALLCACLAGVPEGLHLMVARLTSADVFGIEGRIVEIEVDVTRHNVSNFVIGGLPGKGIKESRERVRSAIINSGLVFPVARILVNLAPAAWEKDGAVFDLAIAMGILLESDDFQPAAGSPWALFGELGLDGRIRSVLGALALVGAARDAGLKRVLVPMENLEEASAVPDIESVGVSSLREAAAVITGDEPGTLCLDGPQRPAARVALPDFAEVIGHRRLKRALAIAVAGDHNVLLVGSPGSGKSLMARRLPGLLPSPSREEVLEITQIHSAAGLKPGPGLVWERPFRAPHHTVSWAGLVGGGQVPRPGEITAAHRGVLFLDELPEFPRQSLEALREPLEQGTVTISRSKASLSFPASFLLVAAMNPCPCGYYLHPRRRCHCLNPRVLRYLERVSGPLLDRIDLRLEVQPPDSASLFRKRAGEEVDSATLRGIVERALLFRRGEGRETSNRLLEWHDRHRWAPLESSAESLLLSASHEQDLSTRGLTRVLRLARTVADAEEKRVIGDRHVHEALEYRSPRGGDGMFAHLGG